MTDNEIIKALKCCAIKTDCKGCYFDTHEAEDICAREVVKNAFDLINRQQAEIAKLEEYIYRCKSGEEYWVKCLLERPNEAIREFAEEIKKRASKIFITNDQDGDEHITSYQFAPETIDDLVREMVGDTE